MGIAPGYNCLTISSDICAFTPVLRQGLDSPAQYRYVLKNIFYIHAFFLDWFHAVDGATGNDATSVIDAIVQEVDPEKKTNTFLGDILTALSAGLAFIPAVGPEVAAGVGVATNTLVTGLQQAPAVAAAIWPSGTANVSTTRSTNTFFGADLTSDGSPNKSRFLTSKPSLQPSAAPSKPNSTPVFTKSSGGLQG
ncbi:MAG: hypothetical protein Q9202_007128 [Teloschistes flavicans]